MAGRPLCCAQCTRAPRQDKTAIGATTRPGAGAGVWKSGRGPSLFYHTLRRRLHVLALLGLSVPRCQHQISGAWGFFPFPFRSDLTCPYIYTPGLLPVSCLEICMRYASFISIFHKCPMTLIGDILGIALAATRFSSRRWRSAALRSALQGPGRLGSVLADPAGWPKLHPHMCESL